MDESIDPAATGAERAERELSGRSTSPTCFRCHRKPSEISEYVYAAQEAEVDPDTYVLAEEGTYNPRSHHFACTLCYIELGQPTAPGRGWKAP